MTVCRRFCRSLSVTSNVTENGSWGEIVMAEAVGKCSFDVVDTFHKDVTYEQNIDFTLALNY